MGRDKRRLGQVCEGILTTVLRNMNLFLGYWFPNFSVIEDHMIGARETVFKIQIPKSYLLRL